MDSKFPQKVHFVGVGGIGMSALAQMLKHNGAHVSGSDRERGPVSEMLEAKGITVMVPQEAANVPTDADLVVYSDAVSSENPERVRAKELSIPQLSYFQMLGKVSRGDASKSSTGGKRTVAVAGTHGKTTTTGMLAKILIDAGAKPTAIIGSIVRDFGSNYVAGKSDLFVVEACEYRDHLLELSPEVLVITNLEWDHTDYFDSLQKLQETFKKAIARVPEHGFIITDTNNPNIAPLLSVAKATIIDYKTEGPSYELLLPGEFNKQNARAAAATARAVYPTLDEQKCAESLRAFQGTWRRFETKGKTKSGVLVYDDYAHHPTAVAGTLKALREKTQGKVFVAFQPHLFSRTRDLLDAFAHAFEDADEILIAPIYAARETDDGTISNEILAEHIRATGKSSVRALSFKEIEEILSSAPKEGDSIMTMGAGDIYKIADALVS